ncbi:MAG TPA: Gfo/Idh/MocA family oxidoreductase [Acidimicrobiia bacterium]|nr:Gfo/Idh/MocA family oxidoreductase [Acidimicrobiia bacterium]
MTADEVRYGVIGAGMMGVEHIRNIDAIEGARVVAIADPHEPSRAAAAATVGDDALALFADHRALLDAELCDAVVIASPNMTHAAILGDVLGRDVHVLVEKPLCTTVEDCRRVLDAARDHAGIVWVGLEYRYMPPVARLIDEVRAGAVGTVRMFAIREHRFPFLPKVGDWNRFNRNTGGTLVEKCCHFFDLMNHVLDATPVSVMASGGADVNHRDEVYDGEVPDILDNAFVIVEYDSGARASLDLCMFAEGSRNQEELSVVGDRGKVEAFLPASTVRVGRRHEGWMGVREEHVVDERVGYEGFHHGSSYLEHLHFVDAIRTGARPAVGLEEGMLSVAVGVAAQRSIAERRVVSMEEVLT